MKINPLVASNIIGAYRTQKSNNANGNVATPADQVSFSDDARAFAATLAKIKEQFDMRTPEDEARVQEIAARVHQGLYQVDSQAVAERLIKNYLDD